MGSGNVSKEDIQREKREMLVKKGVQERGKLEVKIFIDFTLHCLSAA
jgi:hypothetical protein